MIYLMILHIKAIKIILESNSDKFNKDLNQRKISIVVGLSTSVFHVLDHNINIFHIHNGSLFEKLDEISGTDELSNKLDDIISAIDSDEVDNEKIVSLNYEAQSLFNDEVNWRNKALQSLADQLEKYDLSIKNTIGLRLQSSLTKKQAKFVSSCRSVHRDISLNF